MLGHDSRAGIMMTDARVAVLLTHCQLRRVQIQCGVVNVTILWSRVTYDARVLHEVKMCILIPSYICCIVHCYHYRLIYYIE